MPLFLLFLLLPNQDANAIFRIDKTSLSPLEREPTFIATGWMYQSGDNLEWANPEFDDSNWIEVEKTSCRLGDLAPQDFDGISWYRVWLSVDSSYFGKMIAMDLEIAGSAELYMNGVLVHKWGTVGNSPETTQSVTTWNVFPKPVTLPHTEKVLIAVRFANYHYKGFSRELAEIGFNLHIGEYEDFLGHLVWFARKQYGAHVFTFGVSAAIALIHLLMFFFFPQSKSNLFYSLLVMGLMLIMWGTQPLRYYQDMDIFLLNFAVFKVGLISTSIFSLLFTFSLFREKIPKVFYFCLALGAALIPFVHFIPSWGIYLFSLICFPLGFLEILNAWRKKKRGAVIVIDGIFLSFFFFAYQMLADMQVIPRFLTMLPIYQEYLVGVLAMVLTMSVYLAWLVANTNKDLEKQLDNVKELSEKTLLQEREAQEEKLRVRTLQMENDRKDLELAEAKKREKLLKELEDSNIELDLMNKELKQTQAQLVQSEKMASLGLLTAGVAHEINTPVGAIYSTQDTLHRASQNIHEILQDELGDQFEENKKLVKSLKAIESATEVIKTGGKRVAGIVKRMKSFARLDEADFQLSDIHQGLDDTLVMLAHELKSGIEIEKNYATIEQFNFAPGQLNQVFLNILMNAVQAIEPPGKIIISTEEKLNNVFVSISDTGSGIPQENLEKIFDPGFTTKGVGVGAGLGLSISYRIIADHKGSIDIDSEIGKGTTFTIAIPANRG